MHIAKLEEHRLAHVAQRGDAARDLHAATFAEVGPQFARGGVDGISRTIRIDSELAEFGEFLAADGDEFGLGRMRLWRGVCGHDRHGLSAPALSRKS